MYKIDDVSCLKALHVLIGDVNCLKALHVWIGCDCCLKAPHVFIDVFDLLVFFIELHVWIYGVRF